MLDFLKQLSNADRWLASFIVILATWVINQLLLSQLHKHMKDVRRFYRVKKTLYYLFVLFDILLILILWISELSSIPTILGLFSAGIAIALRDLFANIAAWFFIVWRKPFEVGDRVAINGVAGDVIDHRLFQFTLNEINADTGDQSTGRIIHVPNAMVFTNVLTNYGQGFQYIWSELSFTLTFESNWSKAKAAFLNIAETYTDNLDQEAENHLKASAKKYMIYYTKLTPIVYTSTASNGIVLTLRYLSEPQRKRIVNERLTEAVLTYVSKQSDVEFAYATQRILVDGIPNHQNI